ncbi:membrane protease YdiL (CAAX protease family) [Halorubrum trapanicum]|uniref:Membrane protease YdiL (CAAX protease family) n=1 Tax=Halorubrum trapanicum TaxID=29284 RepID=A0A8J7RRA4_9EURY|nr:CPBP family intramembrane glutamic endopeptidase [Halorubrum trapanicum]MBP1900502.1 membrane protease YdiL (CAAX protease family) [Halorubrum trapanicum]
MPDADSPPPETADGLLSGVTEIPPVTLANVAVALFALPLFSFLSQSFVEIGPIGELAVQWTVAAAVLGVAVAVEGQSLPDVGFRRPAWIDLGYLLAAAAAALLAFAATDPAIEALGLRVADDAGTMTAGASLGVALAGAVTAGVVEEVLFRGYAIERLLAYTGRPLVAGGIAWGAFTAAHAVVWPVGNLVQIAAVAAVFTAVYVRRRTLAPVVVAHVLVWGMSALGQAYG